NDIFTLSFFTEDYRDALKFCGANSGRNVDKIKKTGLIPIFIDSTIAFEQAEITLICKKLYKQKLEPECFIDKSLLSNYSENDYHIAFTAEIIKALKKQ
ncbi:MAG: flavin reductase family protein, partial [Oscillospiraceae bacterium]